VREIAETIGRRLGVPAVRVPAEHAADHFGFFAPFSTLDLAMSSVNTQELLGWEPNQPGLIADLEQDHYFTTE
jgi:nucleoside-diphosphate-sugar epimerase